MSKSWFRWTKNKQPRDTLTALYDPRSDPQRCATNSSAMAELALKYHASIQLLDIAPPGEETDAAVATTTAHVRRKLSRTETQTMSAATTDAEVSAAIDASHAGSAAGLDGIIYEFWKALKKRHAAPART